MSVFDVFFLILSFCLSLQSCLSLLKQVEDHHALSLAHLYPSILQAIKAEDQNQINKNGEKNAPRLDNKMFHNKNTTKFQLTNTNAQSTSKRRQE